MKNKTVALEVGHGPTPSGFDPGAMSYGNLISEYELNKIAAQACKAELAAYGINADIIDENLSLGGLGKRAQGYLCFVSIHHNSYNGKVQGIETLIERTTSNETDREFAECIQRSAMKDKISRLGRGVKEQGLAVLKAADNVGAVSCLHECYFIDSLDWDLEKFKVVSKESGKKIANGIKTWADKKDIKFDQPSANPLPIPTQTESSYPYVPATLPLDGSYLETVRALQGLGDAPKKSLSSAEFDNAVRTFQRKNSLVVDGIVGDKTLLVLDRALTIARGNKTVPQPKTSSQITYAKLTRTSQKDEYGCYLLTLEIGDKTLQMVSGQPNAQWFRKPSDPKSYPGNMEPIPQGTYTIGDIEWADDINDFNASHGAGLGPVWVPLTAQFSDDRGAFGFHLDANRSVSPGSAGCVVARTLGDLKYLVLLLQQFNPNTLIVEWGL